MGDFKDYVSAMRMRDTIKRIVREVLQEERPEYRYGTVESVDLAKNRAWVIYNGDSISVPVPLGAHRPSVGDVVRIDGLARDRHISEVVTTAVNDDTGWLALDPLLNGWTPYGSVYPGNSWSPRYRKKNGVVYIEGLIRDNPTGTATSDIFFNLDSEFRPVGHTMRAANTSGGGQTRYDVLATGACTMSRGVGDGSASTSWISISASFPVG